MRRFDYRAAKASGVSDDEIARYLDQKNAAGDSLYIAKEDLGPAPPISQGIGPMQPMPIIRAPGSSSMPETTPPPVLGASGPLSEVGPSLLPTIGGFAGGWIGRAAGAPFGGVGAIPGEIAGAGIGGGIGEGARQLISGEGLSWPGIGAQAGIQAASQGLGMGIGGVASKVAPGLMQKALGIVPTLSDRFNTTPEEMAKMVLGKRLAPTAAGLAKARAASAGVAASRASGIAATKGLVGPGVLATAAISDAEKALGRRLTMVERGDLTATMRNEANDILSGMTHGAVPKTGSKYSARELEQIKEAAQARAKGAYRAERAGLSSQYNPVMNEQMAASAGGNLESRIPGIRAQNLELQNLKAARLAIKGALSKSSGDWTPLRVGPMSVGLKVPRDQVGKLALILTDKRFQFVARQFPRAAAAALQDALSTMQQQ